MVVYTPAPKASSWLAAPLQITSACHPFLVVKTCLFLFRTGQVVMATAGFCHVFGILGMEVQSKTFYQDQFNTSL
jgi:hypothetical protein